ncbi:peptide-methionine (S)-S-oxide reductase MsrA [Apibacter muscae]|nr:peptide-methionine (S)-S-oxide reductase MsrA [Apibacter muscae]
MKQYIIFFVSVFLFFIVSCQTTRKKESYSDYTSGKMENITIGGGCFWCLSPCFEMLKGVYKVTSGYSGGSTENPSYEEVCTGETGHAEVIQIEYNPEEISLSELLDAFWYLHDPTQLNRQGNDVGTQYRSIILYNSQGQKILAEESMLKSQNTDLWKDKYVTEIKPLTKFYPAELYHQDYFKQNPTQPYCSIVISPKVKKFRDRFYYKIKSEFK